MKLNKLLSLVLAFVICLATPLTANSFKAFAEDAGESQTAVAKVGNTEYATIDDAREVFKDQEEVQKEQISPNDIINKVCDYYGISHADITGKKKSKDIVEPRMIAIYLIVELLDMPLIAVGKLFGGRDHTTIIHARDKITDQLKTNNKIRTIVGEIKNIISSI